MGLQPPDIEQPDLDLPLRRGRLSEPANLCAIDGLPSDCQSMMLALQSGGTLLFARGAAPGGGGSRRVSYEGGHPHFVPAWPRDDTVPTQRPLDYDPELENYVDHRRSNQEIYDEYYSDFNSMAALMFFLPQEPAVGPGMQHWLDVYNGCVSDHFGKSTGVPIPPHDAASIILAISSLEGTAESLLAVTWASESPNQGFGQYFNSNPNDGSSGNADVGPFQLNYRTYGNDPGLAGLGDVFGGTTTGSELFRGDPTSNGRMAARILNGYGGGRRAAILFTTGTGPASRSAQGRARARDRGGKYDRWHRKYDDFFGCLKDRR